MLLLALTNNTVKILIPSSAHTNIFTGNLTDYCVGTCMIMLCMSVLFTLWLIMTLSNAVQLMYLHSGAVIGTAGGLIFHCDVAPD